MQFYGSESSLVMGIVHFSISGSASLAEFKLKNVAHICNIRKFTLQIQLMNGGDQQQTHHQ